MKKNSLIKEKCRIYSFTLQVVIFMQVVIHGALYAQIDQELIERYAPILYKVQAERYFPSKIETLLEYGSLYDDSGGLITKNFTKEGLRTYASELEYNCFFLSF